MISSVHT